MICGTPYSPAKAFVEFAHNFYIALSEQNFGEALSRLDMSKRKWTKTEIEIEISKICKGSTVCSPVGIKKSASPVLEESEDKDTYILTHKIPCNDKWLDQCVVFKFERSKGEYFKVVLAEFIC